MKAIETFTHEGVTITVQRPNGFTRQKKWKLSRLAMDIQDEIVRDFALEVSYHLANTISVEGDLGFPVPNGNVTTESLEAFARGLGEADETLLLRWDNAIAFARIATNDPDLLPPSEIDDAKKKTSE